MAKKTEYRDDPTDGGRALVAGEWARQKHDLLADYIIATSGMRGKPVWGRCTYVDLFCGPGRVWYGKHAQRTSAGSALRAWEASLRGQVPFDEIFINDLDTENVEACASRLRQAGASKITTFNLTANAAAPLIRQRLRDGVHLVFIDPFKVELLPWSLVKPYASQRNIDVVVNFNLADLARTLHLNLSGQAEVLDAACPGWREAIHDVARKGEMRGRIIRLWLQKLASECGALYSREMPLIRDARMGVPKYHVVFAAHHPAPVRVWGDVAREPTGALFD
jgi:three-Cys-motif partner protein